MIKLNASAPLKTGFGPYMLALCGVAALSLCAAPPMPELSWRQNGYEPETPMLANPLKDAKLTASGQWRDRGPHFVVDGKVEVNNHWACEKLPATLTVELAKPATLGSARIWFYFKDARIYKFFMESSTDGKQWRRVADWSANQQPASAEGFSVPFTERHEARLFRITVTDSSMRQAGAHIVELQLFPVDTPPADGGLQGRNLPLERVTAENALGPTHLKSWHGSAWRNERVNAQFVVWAWEEIGQLRLECSPLRTEKGVELAREALKPRFVRYVWADGQAVGDVLDTAERLDLPAGGFRPVWLTITVPPNARPGIYRGSLDVVGQGGRSISFPLELEVLAAKLSDARDWRFFLDLWQHPWAIARYHGVAPFSRDHYRLMEPIYRELADAGQKTLTISITDKPWNHQNFDPYHSMIKRTLNADGSWSFDYALFDEYVAFGRKCGLGPQIHCYTMATWGNRVNYIDGQTGDNVVVERVAGTPEHEAYWGAFLADFQRHLRKKGWAGDTHIALDERSPEELRAVVACLRTYAPLLKIAMAGNKPPSSFTGIDMTVYSQSIGHVNDAYLSEVLPRRRQGQTTTFYICCGPRRPNTFTASPCAEQLWLGYYTAATGLDGMLRWAFCNWPREPLWDTSFRAPGWPAGDTFLIYPGPRSSVRWEMFRDGIEECEKIRHLRLKNLSNEKLEQVLSQFSYPVAAKQSDDELAQTVETARRAVEEASRNLR